MSIDQDVRELREIGGDKYKITGRHDKIIVSPEDEVIYRDMSRTIVSMGYEFLGADMAEGKVYFTPE